MAATFSEEDVRRITAAAVEEALRGANREQRNACSGRKPDLPPFDSKRIEEWLRRVENAYTRASIISPEDKFAFLEGRISVELNPKINEFFNGPATQENWTALKDYLRKEYGRTRKQQASTLIDGVRRDGKRPSQLFAQIKDLSKDATVDDIRKELLLREMPATVRSALAEKIETMTGEEAAAAADHYFDKNGKFLHDQLSNGSQASVSTPPSINEVTTANRFNVFTTTAFSEPFVDDDQAVNAVGRKFSQRPLGAQPRYAKQSGGHPQQHAKTGQTVKNEASKAAPKAVKANPNYPVNKGVNLCHAHFKFGDKARYCEVSCSRFDENRYPGNGQAGQK
ncbi:MAG: hypothetical protein VX367_05325 [SAR324 cluster bacterium]|nr:hypothetical protein [SAR324 cluster bacterium]